ncbi:hypothetical protein Hanom_Chr17g01532791 [Helianthus anomalus]
MTHTLLFLVCYRVDGRGLPKFWIWSLTFQKCTHLVPNFTKSHMDGPCGLHFVTHLVPKVSSCLSRD